LRASLALVLHFLEIDSVDIPDFLKSSSNITPRDLRNILQDNHEMHDLITILEKKIVQMMKKHQRAGSQSSFN
jgi:hypothetical protein